LLLGNRRPSLAVIRSLRRAGYQLAVGINGRDERNYNVQRSRFVSLVWEHIDWQVDAGEFTRRLHEFLAAHPEVVAIFPIDENAIRHVAPLREELEQRVVVILANDTAIEVCLDKEAMLDTCRGLGVPCAEYRVVESESAMIAACRELGYPCVVKPLDAEELRFGLKAALLREEAELSTLRAHEVTAERRLLVQRYVEGPRHNVYFAAQGGKLIGAVEVHVLRTDNTDGTGLAVWGRTVAPSPDLQRYCGRLVEALDYTGVGCAQFLIQEGHSTASFLEVNPRLGANFVVAERAGLPLSRLALELARGETPGAPADPWDYIRDLRFAWTFGALAGCRFELREGRIGHWRALRLIGRALADAVRADLHITWSWRDPLPSLLELARPFTHKPTARPETAAPVALGRLKQLGPLDESANR
jgi:biotin carboxylase